MSVTLHEIEPGVWIVPDLVASVTVKPLYNGMYYEGYAVHLFMVGGGELDVRAYRRPLGSTQGGPDASGKDGWIEFGQQAARSVVAWIDERRTDGVTFASGDRS